MHEINKISHSLNSAKKRILLASLNQVTASIRHIPVNLIDILGIKSEIGQKSVRGANRQSIIANLLLHTFINSADQKCINAPARERAGELADRLTRT